MNSPLGGDQTAPAPTPPGATTGANARAWLQAHLPQQRTAPGYSKSAAYFVGVVGLHFTGYRDTEIRARGDGHPPGERFRWSFGPGADRPEPLRAVNPAVWGALERLSSDLAQVSVGWSDGPRRHHLAAGSTDLSQHLRSAIQPSLDLASSAAAGIGLFLRGLTHVPLPELQPAPPAALLRLAGWLDNDDVNWCASEMFERLRRHVGESRLTEYRGWIEELRCTHLVHGRAGLRTAVLPEAAAPATILVGDELASGPRDFDLAWALGEIYVDRNRATQWGARREPADERWRIAMDALVTAYGPGTDIVQVGRMTLLRVLLELHDSAAYCDELLIDLLHASDELRESVG